jgi:hypothetical protein
MDRFFHAKQEWERLAQRELYREYQDVLTQRKIPLRPAAVEIFESETHWGQWDPCTRTIRLARRLLQSHSWFQVMGILLHEMAHQMVDELSPGVGLASGPHGEAFRQACLKLGIPAEFSKASADLQSHNLDWREQKRDEASEKMLEKVQKLLALAESSNENEALLAMSRVRELYAKHNLEQLSAEEKSGIIHIVLSLNSKRIQAYEQQIVGILVGHFFVQILAGALYDAPSGERYRCLEIIGTRENAIMAEYVYHFLKQQTAFLLKAAEKSALQTRGYKFNRLEKKSYRMGILKGFMAKLKAAEDPGRASAKAAAKGRVAEVEAAPLETVVGKALVAFEKDTTLNDYISRVYPRLRRSGGSSYAVDGNAFSAGHDAGKRISLNRPITSSEGSRGRLLGTRSSLS